MMEEKVILVDAADNPVGVMEKMAAHQEGKLHRAFSVFIINTSGEMLIHQRADDKYHSAGLWTNACCSHPRPGEATSEAAGRRLSEEMGMSCELIPLFEFSYRAELDNNLVEHEYDHVFLGESEAEPAPDKAEVKEFRWVNQDRLLAEVVENPGNFTTWFRIALPEVLTRMKNLKKDRQL